MKDDEKSLQQRLANTLASPARKLLQRFRQVPQQTAAAASKLSGLAEGEAIPDSYRQSFSSELFAELLIELPDFQQKFSHTYRSGDLPALGNHVHRLLGAVAYCDAPELETALRRLRRAIIADNADSTDNIDSCYLQVNHLIDSTLQDSGCPVS